MPILDSCCGCGSLKTGTIITGVLGVVIGIVTLILVLVTDMKFQTIIIDTLPETVVKIIFAINLVMTVLISLLLIVGAIKRNKFMMLPWVALAILLAVGLVISIIYTAVVCFMDSERPNHVLRGSLWLALGLPAVAVYVYLWVVVYSYFQLLMEEAGRGKYGKPLRR
ncbi:hypothetical protein R5R35_005614 [Gryllus longicercus]|uniref:Uncharacterized protein n=1 Tax=Gryllus longicercus TaxID=2509291 RepID=A0AAN9VNB6_9ORTH|nr:uncharacterized protein GBIM_06032 [Gryllus bimaculatus]